MILLVFSLCPPGEEKGKGDSALKLGKLLCRHPSPPRNCDGPAGERFGLIRFILIMICLKNQSEEIKDAWRQTGWAGRPPGRRNQRTREVADAVAAAAASDTSPLSYMLSILKDENADQRRRDDMARAAAPFVHPRINPIAEGKAAGDTGGTISVTILPIESGSHFLSPAQVERLTGVRPDGPQLVHLTDEQRSLLHFQPKPVLELVVDNNGEAGDGDKHSTDGDQH